MPTSPLQEIVCVFGQPVAGNPTQYMMEQAFAKAELDWRYLTLEVPPESLADAVKGLRAMGFRGGNLTIPHKVTVIPLLDTLSPAAELMGAVNCIVRNEGRLRGENTDGQGFVESLRGVTEPAGKRVTILGAGGAARAIAVELALAGIAELTIVNRSPERAESLARLIRERTNVPAEYQTWAGEYAVGPEMDVFINATSIGLNNPSARVPVQWQQAKSDLIVADVVFNPAETRFLREARDRGMIPLDGLGMIVNQGAIAFGLWTGVEPDRVLMREAVEEFLS